jgi:hypothetical protein
LYVGWFWVCGWDVPYSLVPVFQKNMLPPYSGRWWYDSLCMKMEAAFPCFPNYIASDFSKLSFNIHQCEKLRSHTMWSYFDWKEQIFRDASCGLCATECCRFVFLFYNCTSGLWKIYFHLEVVFCRKLLQFLNLFDLRTCRRWKPEQSFAVYFVSTL